MNLLVVIGSLVPALLFSLALYIFIYWLKSRRLNQVPPRNNIRHALDDHFVQSVWTKKSPQIIEIELESSTSPTSIYSPTLNDCDEIEHYERKEKEEDFDDESCILALAEMQVSLHSTDRPCIEISSDNSFLTTEVEDNHDDDDDEKSYESGMIDLTINGEEIDTSTKMQNSLYKRSVSLKYEDLGLVETKS